eukprot:gene16987-20216_t
MIGRVIQGLNKYTLPIQDTTNEEIFDVMNKTKRKTLKKHRKRIEGKSSNMRRC